MSKQKEQSHSIKTSKILSIMTCLFVYLTFLFSLRFMELSILHPEKLQQVSGKTGSRSVKQILTSEDQKGWQI